MRWIQRILIAASRIATTILIFAKAYYFFLIYNTYYVLFANKFYNAFILLTIRPRLIIITLVDAFNLCLSKTHLTGI